MTAGPVKEKSDGRSPGTSGSGIFAAAACRVLVFTLLWWGLSEQLFHLPWVGLLAILISAWLSLHCVPPGSWPMRPWRLLAFFPYFLSQSFLAGLDVSRRALDPRLPVEPGVLQYPLSLGSEPAKVFLVWVVSLLPGTASLRLQRDVLTVHVLTRTHPHPETFRELERRIGLLFGEALSATAEDD